jgi:glycosyltransferase involved in cell wall biosynthesis
MLLTVFTPTYNRAYSLRKLYDSLCGQTFSDFEWLVVDDGSTDDTENLVHSFIDEEKILIRYIKQENGGKHRAINRGVQEARGELFFIVDSDDYLTVDALQLLSDNFDCVDETYVGISGRRQNGNGEYIGGILDYETLDCTYLELCFKYHIECDMAEAWRTDILRQYPFPSFDGEFFCPEALVWNRFALKYKIRYFNKGIYICEYLKDGLTAKITGLRMQSAGCSMLYYSELNKMNIPRMQKRKAAINFWRFAFCKKGLWSQKISMIGLQWLIYLLPGFIFHRIDCFKA